MSADDGRERGIQASKAVIEATMENDMLRAQLMSLRQAYEELQREKGKPSSQTSSPQTVSPRVPQGQDSQEVAMLREQLNSVRIAYKQLQEEKGSSQPSDDRGFRLTAAKMAPAKRVAKMGLPTSMASALSLRKLRDGSEVAHAAGEGALHMEADMMREQMESLRKAYMELQEEHERALRSLASREDSDSDVEEMREEVARLEAVAAAATERAMAAEKEVEKQQSAAKDAREALQAAEQRASLALQEKEESNLRALELSAQAERANAQTLADSFSLGAAQERVAKLEQEIAELQAAAALQAPQSPDAANSQPFPSQNATEASQVDSLAEGASGLELRCRELAEKLDAAKSAADENAQHHISEMAVAKAKISELVAQMDRLRALSCEEGQRVVAAQASANEYRGQLEALQADLQEMQTLRGDLQASAEEVTRLNELLQHERSEAAALHETVTSASSREEELRRELEDARTSMQAAKADVATADAKVSDLQSAVAAEVERANAAKDEHASERASWEANAATLREEMEQLRHKAEQQGQDREKGLRNVIQQLQKEVQNLRSELEKVEEQRRGLQRKLREREESGAVGIPDAGMMTRKSSAQSQGPASGGMLYMVKIEELEAENARLQEQVHSGSALFVPKIQQLEAELDETRLELDHASEALVSLQQDVASKATMIRELLQSSGLHSQSSGRMARIFRALHVFSSKSRGAQTNTSVHADDDAGGPQGHPE